MKRRKFKNHLSWKLKAKKGVEKKDDEEEGERGVGGKKRKEMKEKEREFPIYPAVCLPIHHRVLMDDATSSLSPMLEEQTTDQLFCGTDQLLMFEVRLARGARSGVGGGGTANDEYSNCTVDPGPSRVVHCPELNACLLNQQDPGIDCQAVHFGYAIPVRVVPIDSCQEDQPNTPAVDQQQQLAQLVLDADQLSADTLAYLLQRHPQLNSSMTDTASAVQEPAVPQEEDIAAIAKQISDHAEAIYQTWKSRGLAPTEILNCHSGGGVNRFKPALTPTTNRHVTGQQAVGGAKTGSQPSWIGSPSPTSSSSAYQNHTEQKAGVVGGAATKSPVVELLASDQTNKLERLVSNFVSEDRARQAANSQTNQSKTLPSSIQFALQKFERKAAAGNGSGVLVNRSGVNRATPVASVAKQQLHNLATQQQQQQQQPLHFLSTQQQNSKFGDTVEVIYPSEGSSEKTPAVTNTWPLKNKIQDGGGGGKRNSGGYGSGSRSTAGHQGHHRHSTPSSQAEFLDEVAKEEERLINALKTGMIIAAEEPTRRSKSSNTVVPTSASSSPSAGVDTVDSTAFSNNTNSSSMKRHQVADGNNTSGSGTVFSNNAAGNASSSVKRRQVAMTSDTVISRGGGAGGATTLNPVRPFLTRGSVAERVLIFEKCPTELGLEKRVKPTVPSWKTTTPSDLQNAKLPTKEPSRLVSLK
ncbi:hypothetical protein LSTR_LSTR005958 [Laodelphax striatellus]|uniref:Uncharacterized protein n=1 Tax=Laodelphax striatellus TaxID=195883 RepID=A0A482WEV8_LAOST|nr:hypothetical protein LSTR_LSTR005958 [Laodelphax striatellus]